MKDDQIEDILIKICTASFVIVLCDAGISVAVSVQTFYTATESECGILKGKDKSKWIYSLGLCGIEEEVKDWLKWVA